MAINEGILPPSIKIDKTQSKTRLGQLSFSSLNTNSSVDSCERPSASSIGQRIWFWRKQLSRSAGSAPQPAPRRNTLPQEIIALDATSRENLLKSIADLLGELSPARFTYLARRSHRTFRQNAWRLVTVSTDAAQLEAQLAVATQHLQTNGSTPLSSTGQGLFIGTGQHPDGKTAFLFPGQGSQYVDMGREIAVRLPCP